MVNLPAYENDVLTVLAYTGGLPGFDAANEIIIQRGYLKRCGGQPGGLIEGQALGCQPQYLSHLGSGRIGLAGQEDRTSVRGHQTA